MINETISVQVYVLIKGQDRGKVYWKSNNSNSGACLVYFNEKVGIKLLARFGIKTISSTWLIQIYTAGTTQGSAVHFHLKYSILLKSSGT